MRQRFEGSSLDAALENAASTLGVERWRIAHKVVVEKRGFLGGIKRVVIEAAVDQSAVPPAEPSPAPSAMPPLSAPASRPGRGPRREGGEGRGRGRRERRGDDRGGSRDRGERRRREPISRPLVAEEAPPQGEQNAIASEVAGWVAEMARLAGLEVELRTEETDERLIVRIYGEDAPLFAERDGELLDATQTIVNKVFMSKTDMRIDLDTLGFKEQRESDLVKQAEMFADRVRKDGREQLLPAMNPTERRIVHLALADSDGVATESRGEGFFKRVAIVPKVVEPATEES